MTEPADDGRRRWTAPAVVVAVLALAGLASTLLPRLAASSAPSAPLHKPLHVALPQPHTIVRDGVTYTIGLEPPMGAERVAAREIRVFTDEEYDASQPFCNAIRPSVRIVREDADSVTLATFDYARRPLPDVIDCSYFDEATPRPPKHYTAIAIRLPKPLGARTLIDARTAEPIGMISMRERPDPGYLPPGYGEAADESFAESEDLIASGEYQNGDSTIGIRFRSRTEWDLRGTVIGRATVHGTSATITDEDNERCVSWSDPPGLVREVCSLPKANFLPSAELVKIANSLRY